jgi:hypothetical protein
MLDARGEGKLVTSFWLADGYQLLACTLYLTSGTRIPLASNFFLGTSGARIPLGTSGTRVATSI